MTPVLLIISHFLEVYVDNESKNFVYKLDKVIFEEAAVSTKIDSEGEMKEKPSFEDKVKYVATWIITQDCVIRFIYWLFIVYVINFGLNMWIH